MNKNFQRFNFAIFFTFVFFCSTLCSAEQAAGIATAPKKLFPGERFSFRIYYLGIPIGSAEAEVREITEIQGRRAYPVWVREKSFPALDWVYKVRNEHRTFIDAEKLYSLRYERKVQEGRYHTQEIIVFNHQKRTASYLSGPYAGQKVPIAKDIQDPLSCGFWFRTLELRPDSSIFIPVHTAGKNWRGEVKMHGIAVMNHPVLGKVNVLEAEPILNFEGIFVRRGKIQGWITTDARRIPFRMKVKIPIGYVTAELVEYHPGREELLEV